MSHIEFVMDFQEYNFRKVFNAGQISSPNTLYISTFNIDINDQLETVIDSYDRVIIVVNPNPLGDQVRRRREYFDEQRKSNLIKLLKKENVHLYFNRYLHAKIVATESVSYVGSSNFSASSANNIESGYISYCEHNNGQIISSFENNIISRSIDMNAFLQAAKARNKIQRGFDEIIPMFERLHEAIENSFVRIEANSFERGKILIDEITILIEMMLNISRVIDRELDGDMLNIEDFVVAAKWESALIRGRENIKTFINASESLQRRAREDELYDTLTMEDYNRQYGEGTTDVYENHRTSFQDAEKSLHLLKSELRVEISNIKSYLYALSTLGKDYRDHGLR